MQKLTEQQVRHWLDSIFGFEGAEDQGHSLSPVARQVTCALADIPYAPTYSSLESLHGSRELRKFRAFLDEIVRVMDDCDVEPWTEGEQKAADACRNLDR